VACLPNGINSFCSSDSQCCGHICDGYSDSCQVCKQSTSTCTTTSQCCAGLTCSSGFCL
jgi:hypothetical protein